jgi:xylulokinase
MIRLVGVDVGTSSVKGIALDESGNVITVAERPHALSLPRPGWAEQDPEDWWAGAGAVLTELDGAHADAIGLTGQMHGLVALDANDRPVRPALLWNDGRAGPQCAEIERRIGLERLVALAGNRAEAGFTAPKLMWLAEHEPETIERTRSVLLPKDYVRLRLTGERATDVSDASGTLWLDVAARGWSGELVEELGAQPAWLPEVAESGSATGSAFGGVPVAAGAGDQAAGALGMGVVSSGDPASVVLGTSGVVFAAQDGYAADELGRVHAFCHAVRDTWHVMGVSLSAAGALRWLHDALGGETPYDVLLEEAARWEPGAQGLLFAPYLAGERTPHSDPSARAAFTGLGLQHDRGALVRAVLEGVAFALADSLELVQALAGRPPAARVSGGGARGRLWLEIVASVLNLPLEIGAADEGAAFGAALLGGVAAGVFADERDAAARCVRVSATVEPRAEWVERYGELRDGYRKLYPALRPLQAG